MKYIFKHKYNSHYFLSWLQLCFIVLFLALYPKLVFASETTNSNLVVDSLDNLTDTVGKMNDSLTGLLNKQIGNIQSIYHNLFGSNEEERNEELNELKEKYKPGPAYVDTHGIYYYDIELDKGLSYSYPNLWVPCKYKNSYGDILQARGIGVSGTSTDGYVETNSFEIAHFLYNKNVWGKTNFTYVYTGFGNPFVKDDLDVAMNKYYYNDSDYKRYLQLSNDGNSDYYPELKVKIHNDWWDEFDRRGYTWPSSITGSNLVTTGGSLNDVFENTIEDEEGNSRSLWDIIKDFIGGALDVITKIFSFIGDIMSGAVDGIAWLGGKLIDFLEWLIVPNEQDIEDFKVEVKEIADEKASIFTLPLNMIVSITDRLTSLNDVNSPEKESYALGSERETSDDLIFTIPEVNLSFIDGNEEAVLIPKTDFNISLLLEQEGISMIYGIYYICMRGILIFKWLGGMRVTIEKVMEG